MQRAPLSLPALVDPLHGGESTASSAALARARSHVVLERKFADRDAVRAQLMDAEERTRAALLAAKRSKERAWRARMSGSPYGINLVAESERIGEEMRVRGALEARRQKAEERRREEEARSVVQQQAEHQVLARLHREKMMVMAEQKRLRALRDVQRSEARAAAAAADVRRRVADASPEIREQRQAEWTRRQTEHRRETERRKREIAGRQRAKQQAVLLRDAARHARHSPGGGGGHIDVYDDDEY